MLRVVLDTNVVVSGLMRSSGPPAALLNDAIASSFVRITSAQLRAELTNVLSRPRVRKRISLSDRALREFVIKFDHSAVFVTPTEGLDVSRDEDDNRVLEAAVAGIADYVVTGDGDLLALGSHDGIPIVTPAQFVGLLPE